MRLVKKWCRTAFTWLMTALLVAGLVPALPEAPFALAESAEGTVELGGGGRSPEGGAAGVPAAEGVLGEDDAQALDGRAGSNDGHGASPEGDAVVLDEGVEDALLDGLALKVLEEDARGEDAPAAESAPADGPALAAQSVSVSNPRVRADSSMEAGQVATWDCVWFGSYPQTEVAPGDAAYASLQSASWDANGDATVGGKRYRRISKDDATYSGYWSSDGYGSATWRYFRYEPIKWRVLKASGGKALVVSDVTLDDQMYNANSTGVTWETSGIRSWLNGYGAASNQPGTDFSRKNFVGTAFSASERSAILTADVVNASNTYNGTTGGNDTRDKVFLLSEAEVYAPSHGFVNLRRTCDEARRCKVSGYARGMGVWIRRCGQEGPYCWWWLRSPGYQAYYTTPINFDGTVRPDCDNVVNGHGGVRPALNLNLASTHLSWAGTVSSNGDVNEQAAPGAGGPGEVYISHGFDPSVHGNSFIHTNGNGSGKTVNKELFETTLGNGQRDEVWHKGQCGFYGVGNVFIMPGDLLRFFGDMRTNPIEYATLGIYSLMPWEGSCLGLSTAIALSFKGGSEALDRAHKARFCEVGPPYLNVGLLSLIQCYHCAGNLDFSPKASWDPSAFVLKGSVDEVARTIIEDVSRDGVSALRFHNGDGNHAILATSVRGDLSADNGEIEIGLFDVNSAGCFLKGSQEPYFVGDSQLTMKLRKTGGRYVGFEFLDVLGTKKRQDSRNERYVYNEQNTSLRVYDYKKESSPPLRNVINTSPMNIAIFSLESSLRVLGKKGEISIANDNVRADGYEEVYNGNWVADATLDSGNAVRAYATEISSEDLVAIPQNNEYASIGISTADGAYYGGGKGIERIHVSGRDGIELQGTDYQFDVAIASDEKDGVGTVKVSGKANSDVSASLKNGELVLENEGAIEDVVITALENGERTERPLDGEIRSLRVRHSEDEGEKLALIVDEVDIDGPQGDLSSAVVEAIPDQVFTGLPVTPKPSVTVDDKALVERVDYSLSYSDNRDIGTASVVITGTGIYTGSKRVSFRIIGNSQPFVDVTDKVAHHGDIAWLASEGISKGWDMPDGTVQFRPYADVARADMAAFLFRLARSWDLVDDSWHPRGGSAFTDVTEKTSHYREVMWLAESGISKGWDIGGGRKEFRPYADVARADMAAFLHRLAQKAAINGSSGGGVSFRDVTTKTAHAEDIAWLAATGVSKGWSVSGGYEFRPASPVARADMAAFLHRLDGLR